MRWLIRSIIGVLLLALIGMGYQLLGMMTDQEQYFPPGELIDVGGHTLHLYCTGEGSPTVVLEAMGLGWSIYWSTVQPEIAKVTRVCSYDRAGFGWSESGPLPRTGRQMADELHRLLTRGGISGPYLLVGHSLGGFVARIYRQAHPGDVAGIVLVDAGHEKQFEQEEFRKFVAPGTFVFPIVRGMTAVGLTRLLFSLDALPPLFAKQEHSVIAKIRPLLRFGWMQTRYFKTMTQEGAALEETGRDAARAGTLGTLPLIVLTATGPTWWPDLPPNIDPAKFREVWLELQADLTKLSTNSRQVFADRSSHFINFDQPEIIVNAVRQLLDTINRELPVQQ
ncbi:MAG: alpha/beta hydrolase [Nitrospira sp.]